MIVIAPDIEGELQDLRRQLKEALIWGHIRQCALEEIRATFPSSPAAKIAGRAMTMGPDSRGFVTLLNAVRG